MHFLEPQDLADKVWAIVGKDVEDSNASQLNAVLVAFIARLAPTARAIVRDFTAGNELQALLCFAIAEACDKIDTFCKDQADAKTVRLVSAKMKRTLLVRRFTNAGRELPWTDHEMRTFILAAEEEGDALSGNDSAN